MFEIDNVLSFDLWGDYANFRRSYSTTSSLTYPFLTRTATAGLIAAILGIPRDLYYEEFAYDNSRIGLQILTPIRKISLSLNFINTKEGYYLWDTSENPRTQVLHEILKDVRWRLYVWLKPENYDKLRTKLKNHTSVYTPYLGMAQMLANFRFIKEYTNIKKKDGSQDSVITVVPEDYGVKPIANHRLGRVNMPMYMDKARKPIYRTLVYDSCANFDTFHHHLEFTSGEYFVLDSHINVVLL